MTSLPAPAATAATRFILLDRVNQPAVYQPLFSTGVGGGRRRPGFLLVPGVASPPRHAGPAYQRSVGQPGSPAGQAEAQNESANRHSEGEWHNAALSKHACPAGGPGSDHWGLLWQAGRGRPCPARPGD